MASPPSKRVRRTVVVSSDDEDPNADHQLSNANLTVTTRSSAIKNVSRTRAIGRQRPSTSKSKTISNGKLSKSKMSSSTGAAITKNASLYSFFNTATQSDRQDTETAKPSPTSNRETIPGESIDEISSDDTLSSSCVPALQAINHETVSAFLDGESGNNSPAVAKSRQFHEQAKGISIQNDESTSDSLCHWTDLFPPESLDELAVHKRKVADVHKWLDNVLKGRERKRLLVLKGPSGSGKTAALKLLVKEVNARLVEWENPVGSSFEDEGFVSLATQFDEFLNRSINFQGLELETVRGMAEPLFSSLYQMVVLIEDFPNTFARGSSALKNFRESVLRYLVASTPPPGSRLSTSRITPVVMIVTESSTTSAANQSESFTVGKLLGPQLLQHQGVTVIEFNPTAPTIMAKAIATVVRKQNRSSTTRWIPSTDAVKMISQSGDIRSSINLLQLTKMYESGQINGKLDGQNRLKPSSKRSGPRHTVLSNSDTGFRDDTIDLFHAVGKILYNKRKDTDAGSMVQPSSYLHHHHRSRVSEVPVNSLYDDIASDVDTFVSTLHENYVLSCYGEDFADNLDDCIANLSDSDLLLSSGNDNSASRSIGRSPPSILQSEYTFQVASRGLLFALPCPVDRGKTLTLALKLGRDPFKMIYPAALRLWRTVDDNETILDDWKEYVEKQNDEGSLVCTHVSKVDMVTQFLPFAARIKPSLAIAHPRQKSGNGSKQNAFSSLDAEEDADVIESSTIPLISTLGMPLPPSSVVDRSNNGGYMVSPGNQLMLSAKREQLILSDDDIEDD